MLHTDRSSEELPVSKVHAHLLLQLVDVTLRQNSAVNVRLKTTKFKLIRHIKTRNLVLFTNNNLLSCCVTDLPDGGAVLSHHALVDAFDLPHTLTDGLRRHGAEEDGRSTRHHGGRTLNTNAQFHSGNHRSTRTSS